MHELDITAATYLCLVSCREMVWPQNRLHMDNAECSLQPQ